MEIVASIGVYEHERRYEQRVLISADLWVRDEYDGVSDRLSDVVDYGKVVHDIEVLVQSEHVNLIETLAERIARQCLTDARVERVRVRIEKPDVARSCKGVGIEIERERGQTPGADPVATRMPKTL
jgi:dihydroneopterin aldolase